MGNYKKCLVTNTLGHVEPNTEPHLFQKPVKPSKRSISSFSPKPPNNGTHPNMPQKPSILMIHEKEDGEGTP